MEERSFCVTRLRFMPLAFSLDPRCPGAVWITEEDAHVQRKTALNLKLPAGMRGQRARKSQAG